VRCCLKQANKVQFNNMLTCHDIGY
jgi:hypothetical protein